MSSYREQSNEYKAKRAGIVDAKIVAPKGRKKKLAKPWVVWIKFSINSAWKPWKHEFQHEHDARVYLAKMQRSYARDSWLEHNGKKIENDSNS